MQSKLNSYRFLIAAAFGLAVLALPAMADTFNEAGPVPQRSPVANEANPEPKPQQDGQKLSAGIAKKTGTPSPTDEKTSFDDGPNDPLEPLNRLIFGINDLLDFVILRPVAEIYRAITPEPVRNGVTNVLDNLFAPVVFLNHVLQGEAERATVTLFRLLMNSTFGLFGLVDVTSDLGYPRYDTDFNQTLMAWGVDTGPYLVLPLIGPSSFRGTIGFIGDYYADPLNMYLNNRHHRQYHYWLTVRYGATMVSHREKVIDAIDNLRNSSLDMYVTMRSIYFQRQAYMAEKLKSAPAP
jgi:phospholipid-binding lipoprotein MlaA